MVQAVTGAWDTGCRLAGCGSSVPAAILSNADLEALVETSDDWIATRTGIRCALVVQKPGNAFASEPKVQCGSFLAGEDILCRRAKH